MADEFSNGIIPPNDGRQYFNDVWLSAAEPPPRSDVIADIEFELDESTRFGLNSNLNDVLEKDPHFNDILLSVLYDEKAGLFQSELVETKEERPAVHSLPSCSHKLDDANFNNRAAERFPSQSVPVDPVDSNVVSTVSYVPSSLPASQNWPGEYNFDVSFSPQDKSTKGVSWTYSRTMDKLYVGKDAPCPINFSTNSIMPDNVRIRAMALYSSPESASEIVVRCINHALEDKAKNIFEAEHLVRCESSSASYEIDATTKRHSVVVPFENPPIGQHFSTYIYKFTCFGSCPFGPNRRPLMLVFTLEKGNIVIGRRKVDVKICACPGRDRKTDEKQSLAFETGVARKRKEPEFMALSETMEFTKDVTFPASKKARIAPNSEGMYRIHVDDPECYDFLKNMKTFFEICKTMKSLPADAKKTLFQYQQRKYYSPDPDV